MIAVMVCDRQTDLHATAKSSRDRQTFTHDIQTMVNDMQTYMRLRGAWDIKSISIHHFDVFSHVLTSEKTKLHHMHIGHIKGVALF